MFFIKARVVHWTLPSTISPVKMVGIYPILLIRKLPFLFIMYSFDVPRNRNLSVLFIFFKKKNFILTFHTYWNSVCVRVWGRYYTILVSRRSDLNPKGTLASVRRRTVHCDPIFIATYTLYKITLKSKLIQCVFRSRAYRCYVGGNYSCIFISWLKEVR